MYQYIGGGEAMPVPHVKAREQLGCWPLLSPSLTRGLLFAPGEPLGTFASASYLGEGRLGLQVHSTTSSFMWCLVILTQVPTLCDKSFTESTP